MNDVEILSKRTFDGADKEVLDCFVQYQQALIDKDGDKLNELMADDYILTHMSGKKQTKAQFIAEVMDGTLIISNPKSIIQTYYLMIMKMQH